MKPAEEIYEYMDNAAVSTNPEAEQRILNDILAVHQNTTKTQPDTNRSRPWRNIMKKNYSRFTTAALVIMALALGMNVLNVPPDGASVVWAEVADRFSKISYMHYYSITSYASQFPSIREGWYAHSKKRENSCGGFSSYGAYRSFDDGKTWRVLDRHNNITCIGTSTLVKYPDFFEAITEGHISLDSPQFRDKTPVSLGSDFLIYDFDPPQDVDWIDKISVTVGRNSLLPMQIKTHYKSKVWYCLSDLLIFDYEEAEKGPDFFELPTEQKPPHGTGQLTLGGDAVEIDLHEAPGIKKAVVRLHTKFDGPADELLIPYRERYSLVGGPVYFMEISFVLDNGMQSITAKKCPLWLNQGVKAALGNDKNWPDGKYRNIRYTPVLRRTDEEGKFTLEISSWLRIKDM